MVPRFNLKAQVNVRERLKQMKQEWIWPFSIIFLRFTWSWLSCMPPGSKCSSAAPQQIYVSAATFTVFRPILYMDQAHSNARFRPASSTVGHMSLSFECQGIHDAVHIKIYCMKIIDPKLAWMKAKTPLIIPKTGFSRINYFIHFPSTNRGYHKTNPDYLNLHDWCYFVRLRICMLCTLISTKHHILISYLYKWQ